MDPHYKPKAVWRQYRVYNDNSYTNKKVCSYWIEALETRPLPAFILDHHEHILSHRQKMGYGNLTCISPKYTNVPTAVPV